MKRLYCILLIFSFGFRIFPVFGTDYYYKQISRKNGLSQSTVTSVTTDYIGIVWIGTRFGLNRYDGEQIRTYYHERLGKQSLPSNEIVFLTEDARQNLWIGTTGGIALYDRDNDRIEPVYFESSNIISYCNLLVEDGIIFWGKENAYKYNYSDKKIVIIPYIMDKTFSFPPEHCYLYDKDRKIAVMSSQYGGVWSYNLDTHKFTKLDYISYQNITTIFVDSSGSLWVSPYGKGLVSYDRKGSMVKQILNNNVIKDIAQRKDELWMVTDGGGLNIYNLLTGEIRNIMHKPGIEYSLPENSLLCLYNDHENNIWIGSIKGGLIGMKEIFIKTYKDVPLNSNYGLSSKVVNVIFEDNNNIIWLGTDGGGLNRFDPQTNIFQHYPSTYNSKIVSITNHNERELLISVFDKGLYLFDKINGSFREYPIMEDNIYKEMFMSGKSVNINKIDSKNIYMYADNVWLYNQTKKELKQVSDTEGNTGFISLNLIQSDPYASYLWNLYGIYEINHIQRKIHTIYSNDSIGTILNSCKDTRGNFWIGTTKGLYVYNIIRQKIERINDERFIGTIALVFDKSGRLWIGTHSTLYLYDPLEYKIILLGESDGVLQNEYIPTSILQSQNGDILIPGTMGLLVIKNDFSFSADKDMTITLIDLLLNGSSINHSIKNKDKSISVPWDYTSLAAKIIVKESDLMSKKLFRFYIKGDQEEVIESMSNTISLPFLPIGKYSVSASCMKNNGEWSTSVRLFTINVKPPWWKTIWFVVIFFSLLLIFAGVFIRFAIKRKNRKMAWAMKEYEQKMYEQKVHFFININHELRTPLSLIYSPLKQLLNSGNIKDDNQSRILSSVLRQVHRIKDIIDMTLDIRKMEMGNEKLNIKKLNINEWVYSVADYFENELQLNQIKLSFNLAPIDREVPFDPVKCEIILSNLLMNAIKFTESGDIITISTFIGDVYFRVSVSDTGIGLDKSDISNIFIPFYQGNHGLKGTGIGLSYSKLLVEMHGGKIGAYNNEKKGATFFYELPLKNQITDIPPNSYLNELFMNSKMERVDMDFVLNKYSLLIVEDEFELRTYLKNTLKGYFKQIYVTEDGEKAIEKILREFPDIIVSDVMMPKMNGFELCKKVKSDLRISHIPIILLTALADSENTKYGYKLGADMYIQKPFGVDFLLMTIKSLLMNREYVKQKYKQNLQTVSPKEETISNADEQFITKLNTLINNNIEDTELDVKFIAENMAMSRSALNTKLKLLINTSIGDYINKFKMIKAVQFLADKNLSIQEVSEKLGFSQQRYFSTVFKKTYGTTPSQYRNSLL